MTIRGGHYKLNYDMPGVGPIGTTSCQSPSELCLTKECFDIVDLGPLTTLLGVEFERKSEHSIIMHQRPYIKKLLKEYGLEKTVRVTVPLPVGTTIECTKDNSELIELYNAFGIKHVNFLKQVLRYLWSTIDYGIDLGACRDDAIDCYTDASWASDRDTRKSFGGYIVLVGCWNCKKQSVVALSTMEAEYMVLVNAAKEAHWLCQVFDNSIVSDQKHAAPMIFTDSMSAMYFTKNPVENVRSKHIDIKYHFLKDS
uniref:Reverse transcriptase Ty1/copia-type domain-containing protein n=1 Tax=Strigamia maritima TaxID=126957 RepID=T1IGZ8_STRMM